MKIELTLGKILALVAIPGALAGAIAGWNLVGWMTPEAHDHDLTVQQSAQSAQYQAIVIQQKNFRDEWWCDEEKETLIDLLAAKDAGDESARLARQIKEQEDKMGDVKCFRFDED